MRNNYLKFLSKFYKIRGSHHEAAGRPTMHCQEELEADLKDEVIVSNQTMFKWMNDRFSTSRHLSVLYAVASGLKANTIAEVGFGRSSFLFSRTAYESGGKFYTVDQRDFSYLLSSEEKKVTHFINGLSHDLWSRLKSEKRKCDFAFLDYFGEPKYDRDFCEKELQACFECMEESGIVCIHDTYTQRNPITHCLKEIAQSHGYRFVVLPYNYGLAILHREDLVEKHLLEDSWIKKSE